MSRASSSLREDHAAGSPGGGEPAFIAVGKLRRPHGLRGEILMDVLTDFPERLKPGAVLYVGPEYQPVHLKKYRWHRQALLATFEGYEDPESAGVFRNQIVYVKTAECPPLPEGDYYHHQLLGLGVVSEAGEVLGTVTQILETGANDVLVVRPPSGSEILLPLIDSVVLDIDLEAGQMRVHLLPGLLDE